MKNITTISDKELIKTLSEKQKAFREFRVDVAGGKTKNVKAGREIKKEVAQILTELSSRANATAIAK